MNYQLTHEKYLTDEEQTSLRARLKTLTTRDETYLLVLLETGARLSEALNIVPRDLIASRSSVFIRGIKGSKDREIAISKDLYARLESLSTAGPPFTFTDATADRLWRRIRPVEKKLHSLRHTFAVNLYRKTKNLKLVSYALGHKNIQNTMIYTELNLSDDLRAALVG